MRLNDSFYEGQREVDVFVLGREKGLRALHSAGEERRPIRGLSRDSRNCTNTPVFLEVRNRPKSNPVLTASAQFHVSGTWQNTPPNPPCTAPCPSPPTARTSVSLPPTALSTVLPSSGGCLDWWCLWNGGRNNRGKRSCRRCARAWAAAGCWWRGRISTGKSWRERRTASSSEWS